MDFTDVDSKLQSEYEDGSNCPQEDCEGKLVWTRTGQCSCHIDPPCFSCVDASLICDKCDWSTDELGTTGVNDPS